MKKPDLLACMMLLFLVMLSLDLMAQFPFYGNSKKPKGRVKSFTESCYETSSGQNVLVQKGTYTYSRDGNILEEKVYSTLDSNLVDYVIKYIYMKKRNSVKKKLRENIRQSTCMMKRERKLPENTVQIP